MATRKSTITISLETKLYNTLKVKFAERGTDLETFIRLQLRAVSKTTLILKLKDDLPFGKYAGEKIEDIVRADPSYMNWVITTNKNPGQFHEEILELLEEISK